MVNYYKILNLSLAKEKGTITDELVRKNYVSIKEQFFKLQENNQINLKSNYLDIDIIEDAYRALATENSRRHYDELVQNISEYLEQKRSKQTNEIKEKATKQEERLQFNEMIKMMSKPINTEELIEEIKKDAQRKHPIQEQEIGE